MGEFEVLQSVLCDSLPKLTGWRDLTNLNLEIVFRDAKHGGLFNLKTRQEQQQKVGKANLAQASIFYSLVTIYFLFLGLSRGCCSNKSEKRLRVALMYAYRKAMRTVQYDDGRLQLKIHNLETLFGKK
jgi:hypothetical protein